MDIYTTLDPNLGCNHDYTYTPWITPTARPSKKMWARRQFNYEESL